MLAADGTSQEMGRRPKRNRCLSPDRSMNEVLTLRTRATTPTGFDWEASLKTALTNQSVQAEVLKESLLAYAHSWEEAIEDGADDEQLKAMGYPTPLTLESRYRFRASGSELDDRNPESALRRSAHFSSTHARGQEATASS